MTHRIVFVYILFFALSGHALSIVVDARLGLIESGIFGDGLNIPNRKMTPISFASLIGIKMGKFAIGINGEYTNLAQANSPDSLNGQNAGGTTSSTGAGISYFGMDWGALLVTRVNSTHKFFLLDQNGQQLIYSGSGYSSHIYRRIKNNWALFIEYGTDNYTKSEGVLLTPEVVSSRYGIGIAFSNLWGSSNK